MLVSFFHLPAAVLTHSNQLTSTSNFQRRPKGSLYLPQKAFRWDCHEECPIGMKIIGYSAQKPLFGMTKISNYTLKSMVSGMMSLFHIIQNYPFIKIIPPKSLGIPAIQYSPIFIPGFSTFDGHLMTASNRARDSRPPSPYFGLSRNPSVQRAGNVQIMQASQVSKIPANLPLRLHIICVSAIQNGPKSLKILIFSKKKSSFSSKSLPKDIQRPCSQFFWSIPNSTFQPPPSGCTWRIKRKRLLGSPHHPWVLGSVVPRPGLPGSG